MCGIFISYDFFSLVRNENIKRPGFYTLQLARVFSSFSRLKQLNKIKYTCEYCDLLELWSAWVRDPRYVYKKPYCDYVSFRLSLLTMFSNTVVTKVVSLSTYMIYVFPTRLVVCMIYAFLNRPFYTQRKETSVNKKYIQHHLQ